MQKYELTSLPPQNHMASSSLRCQWQRPTIRMVEEPGNMLGFDQMKPTPATFRQHQHSLHSFGAGYTRMDRGVLE